MTVFILPCGTSVLSNLRAGDRGSIKCFEQVRQMERWADEEGLADEGPDRWANAVDDRLRPRLPTTVQRRLISAECSSLWQPPIAQQAPRGTDTVVLLASATNEGVLAALVNALLIGGQVTFHTGPPGASGTKTAEIVAKGDGPTTHVVRIGGLLPNSTETFTEAMVHVALALRWAATLDGARALYLAGGYKATVPYLVVLTEYLRAQHGQVRTFCLHEGDGTGHPPPVEIYLRKVDPEADTRELDAATAGSLGPTEGRLRNFAYERRNDGRDHLTPLGHAIRALLR